MLVYQWRRCHRLKELSEISTCSAPHLDNRHTSPGVNEDYQGEEGAELLLDCYTNSVVDCLADLKSKLNDAREGTQNTQGRTSAPGSK